MILVLAGTQDGREIACQLGLQGYNVTVSVASEYGAALVQQAENVKVIQGKLQLADMKKFIMTMGISVVVDATHPFAKNVSENAIQACRETFIHYLRYERDSANVEGYSNVVLVDSYHEAVEKVNEMDGMVFLTTGSNSLDIFINGINDRTRIAARVLPGVQVMNKCIGLGLQPSQIIAMQGPFSRELNREMFKHYNTAVVVTKESGNIGGIEDKILAARDIGIPIIVITRPGIDYPLVVGTFEQVLERIEQWEK
ncbi:MAG: precorrin-6x reductase [Clostridia bacterium]|jgi:precorrin-6A/cobalt-precorrin-6A reductase|nr:precorrin-6x reductase [Clostridia bacterium]